MIFRRRRPQPLTWAVVVASPKGEAGDQWGDTWFGRDLVDALERAGEHARLVYRGGGTSEAREHDDVVVVLRGLRRFVPRRGNATWLLWVISHPELVERDEPAQYDAVFAASAHWSRAQEFGMPITPLLQATNPHRFTPAAAEPDSGADLLFVGSTRGEFRPAVRYALDSGHDLSVFGVGWEKYLPPERIGGEFIPNADLPAAYAGAGILLNDHWRAMADEGFLSNRLFDAVASGCRVLSDEAVGLSDVFDGTVVTYRDAETMASLLGQDRESVFPDRAARLAAAERVAHEHSFDARARVLIERARALRAAG